jgi:hypothetical protein
VWISSNCGSAVVRRSSRSLRGFGVSLPIAWSHPTLARCKAFTPLNFFSASYSRYQKPTVVKIGPPFAEPIRCISGFLSGRRSGGWGSRSWCQLEVRGACSSNEVEASQRTSRKFKICVVQPEADLQYQFLLDGSFHPHGLSWCFHCGRRDFTSQRRSPRHGNGDGRGGRWGCLFFFGLGPGGGAGRTTGGHCKYDIISAYGNTVRQATSTRKIRLLAPSASALSDDLAAPAAKRRSTPRSAQRGCPDVFPLQLPPLPGSPHPRWTHCCVELRQCELFLPQQRHWGGGGPAGGYQVAVGSCGTALYVPAEDSSVK